MYGPKMVSSSLFENLLRETVSNQRFKCTLLILEELMAENHTAFAPKSEEEDLLCYFCRELKKSQKEDVSSYYMQHAFEALYKRGSQAGRLNVYYDVTRTCLLNQVIYGLDQDWLWINNRFSRFAPFFWMMFISMMEDEAVDVNLVEATRLYHPLPIRYPIQEAIYGGRYWAAARLLYRMARVEALELSKFKFGQGCSRVLRLLHEAGFKYPPIAEFVVLMRTCPSSRQEFTDFVSWLSQARKTVPTLEEMAFQSIRNKATDPEESMAQIPEIVAHHLLVAYRMKGSQQ
jgi:hypothetical protein